MSAAVPNQPISRRPIHNDWADDVLPRARAPRGRRGPPRLPQRVTRAGPRPRSALGRVEWKAKTLAKIPQIHHLFSRSRFITCRHQQSPRRPAPLHPEPGRRFTAAASRDAPGGRPRRRNVPRAPRPPPPPRYATTPPLPSASRLPCLLSGGRRPSLTT